MRLSIAQAFNAVCAGLLALEPLPADFLRGDANRDGKVSLADALMQVRALFGQEAPLPCADAADSDDDGALRLSDALVTLGFLFGDGAIPSPGPRASGPDPTCDSLGCRDSAEATPAVLLSEIHYNHAASPLLEYVELYNRTSDGVDVSGYRFIEGILFTIPEGTVIPAGGFALVVRNPEVSDWRRLAVPVVGPYEGGLANDGERVTLVDGSCVVESVRYNDRPPWPTGADGYGPALERIDYLSPADDHHSWRASTSTRRTPGAPNSTFGTPTRPLILFAYHTPAQPASADSVEVEITLDIGASAIQSVTLHWETAAEAISQVTASEMRLRQDGWEYAIFVATLPPLRSQTLVRYRVDVALAGGPVVTLPHPGEPQPLLSYFVYDLEVRSTLPVLWLFPLRRSELTGRSATGAVIQEVGASATLVFDGARLTRSNNGMKLKFLHGAEYREDRTLNIIPEEGGGGTGSMAPHMEHLGLQTFRDLGALAPRAAWFRVIDYGSNLQRHTQRLLIQQVNERFLRLNGLNESGDLYKLDKNSFRKQTNVETGNRNLQELLALLRSRNPEVSRAAVLERLDVENVRCYSVISVLIENWDGFHNNLFAYHDGSELGRWKVIPWDLDQVFEPCCANFPVTYPLNGVFPGNGRTRSADSRYFSEPFHSQSDLDQEYREILKASVQPGGPFTVESIEEKIAAVETLLLEDLELQEAYLGTPRAVRRAQIRSSYTAMRQYMQARIPYLMRVLE